MLHIILLAQCVT